MEKVSKVSSSAELEFYREKKVTISGKPGRVQVICIRYKCKRGRCPIPLPEEHGSEEEEGGQRGS